MHIELDRVTRDCRETVRETTSLYSHHAAERDTLRERERSRGRSPEPVFNARQAVEMAEVQEKLDKANTELRRAQAELRLNQTDYDRSHVEMEQMQEKVKVPAFAQETC